VRWFRHKHAGELAFDCYPQELMTFSVYCLHLAHMFRVQALLHELRDVLMAA
jgi:hypothetical protein